MQVLLNPISQNNSTKHNKKRIEPSFGAVLQINQDALIKGTKPTLDMFHKFGGNINALVSMIHKGETDAYTHILPFPIFGRDSISGHGYFTENLGWLSTCFKNGMEDFANLITNAHDKNITIILDGAFNNEGLLGIHFSPILKYKDSPYNYWFNIGDKIKLGALGTSKTAQENISHKIINSPNIFVQDTTGKIEIKPNPQYNELKPTEIQLFDKRFVEKSDNNKPIEAYDEFSQNPLEINNFTDSVLPYHFEINPQEYIKNIKLLNNSAEKFDIASYNGTKFLTNFSNFEITDVKHAGGYDRWGNRSTLAQYNYGFNPTKTNPDYIANKAAIERGSFEVMDNVINKMKYIMKTVKDIKILHIAKNLNSITENSNPKTGKLKKDIILHNIFEFPLDTIEFNRNIASLLSSPYITRLAARAEDIAKPKSEINISEIYRPIIKQMDNLKTNDIYKIINNILENLNNKMPEQKKLFEGEYTTKYGEQVLPIIVPKIMKYLIIKSLAPHINITLSSNKYVLKYDLKEINDICTQFLKINNNGNFALDSRDLITHIKNGLPKIDKEQISSIISEILENTSTSSLEQAEKICLENEGLSWRFDAAKDVAVGKTTDDKFDSIEFFLGKGADEIHKIFPKSKIYAELTDLKNWIDTQKSQKYNIEQEFTNHLGQKYQIGKIGYDYFYSELQRLFGVHSEDGYSLGNDSKYKAEKFRETIKNYLENNKNPNLIFNMVTNQDKPNILHLFSINEFSNENINLVRLFNSDFESNNPEEINNFKKIATKVLTQDYSSERILEDEIYDKTSSKAIAMAYAIRNATNDLSFKYEKQRAIEKALSDLVQGKFKKYPPFDPENFGVVPLTKALKALSEQIEFNNNIHNTDFKLSEDDIISIMHRMLDNPIKKEERIYSTMCSFPGNPATKLGPLGWESKANNRTVQNRYGEDELFNKAFPNYQKNLNTIVSIRKNGKLSALNNGEAKLLPKSEKDSLETTLLIENNNGDSVISITNISDNPIGFDAIKLNFTKDENPEPFISKNLKKGDNLKDLNGNDYKVVEYQGKYFIKKLDSNGEQIHANNAIMVGNGSNNVLYLYKVKDNISFGSRKNFNIPSEYICSFYSKCQNQYK